jgi:hypothetical protein
MINNHSGNRRSAWCSLLFVCMLLQAGCTSTRAPENEAIDYVDQGAGYRVPRGWEVGGDGRNTFRAANLAPTIDCQAEASALAIPLQ